MNTITMSKQSANHNQTRLSAQGLKVRTAVKAGNRGRECPEWGCGGNHNQTLVRKAA